MPGHQRRPSDECEQIVRKLSGMDRPPPMNTALRYHSLDHPSNYGNNDPSLSLSAVGSMMQKVSVLMDHMSQCHYIMLQVYSDSLLTNPLLFADDAPSFNNLQITPPTPIRSNSRDGAMYKSDEDLSLHQLSPEMFDHRRMSAPLPQQPKNLGLMNVPVNFDMRRQSDPSAGVPTISISPTEPSIGSLTNALPVHVTSPINSE